MLPNPRFIVFVGFCCFFSRFGDGLSDTSGHGVVTKRTSTNSEKIDKQDTRRPNLNNGSHNELKKKFKKQSQIIYQPVPLKIRNQTSILTKIKTRPTLEKSSVPNKNPQTVPVNLIKSSDHKETKSISTNMMSKPKFGLDFGSNNSKKKKSKKDDKSFMERILPMMVTPFLISSAMVPMMLIALLHMLVKGVLIGKIGLILMLINMFSNRRNPGGVSHHELDSGYNGNDVAKEYYGWHGDEEYGAYVNRKRKR